MGLRQSKSKSTTRRAETKIQQEWLDVNVRALPASLPQHLPTAADVVENIAVQQLERRGKPLVKVDLVAILLRLNPNRYNNALLAVLTVANINDCIRNELFGTFLPHFPAAAPCPLRIAEEKTDSQGVSRPHIATCLRPAIQDAPSQPAPHKRGQRLPVEPNSPRQDRNVKKSSENFEYTVPLTYVVSRSANSSVSSIDDDDDGNKGDKYYDM